MAVGQEQAQPSACSSEGLQGSRLRNQRRVLTWDPNLTQTAAISNGLEAITLLQGSSPLVCISHKVVGACD